MKNLEDFLQDDHGIDPLIEMGLCHYQFETIHPFLDGNGRMGRLLITLMLYKRGLLPHPFLYLSSYFNRHREEYVQKMFSVSTNGEREEWLLFFLEGVSEQANEAFVRSKTLLDLKEAYREKYRGERSTTVMSLISMLFDNPIITVRRAKEKLDISDPTARSNIEKLEEDGILTERTGKSRYRVYEATEVMRTIEKPLEELGKSKNDIDSGSDGLGNSANRQSGLAEYV